MAVPNFKSIVEQVRNSQQWPFRSKEQLCAYSHAVIVALHNENSNFGKLRKIPAQNHCVDPSGLLGAVDVALYKPTGQIIDFISSAGFEPDTTKPEPPNSVTWGVGPENEYGPSDWFAPSSSGNGGTEPPNGELAAKVAALEGKVATLQSEVNNLKATVEANRVRMEAINSRFDEESKNLNVHKPLPNYFGRLFGIGITSRPVE